MDYKNAKVVRSWGWYKVLNDKINYKVKELVILSGKSLSMQRHFLRSEHWYLLDGKCHLIIKKNGIEEIINLSALSKGYLIPTKTWHKAINSSDKDCHILEVQYGVKCVEEDIERE
ncbi:MAG: phosphomannose isomerase type II C-terminal cupin domain [Gammaproteobacteria bacterium]|jgi:mannose-6-phosphate isomerase-like protein (cupin superfamily)|nr:phosphomannose isomerase type II C-terminal cupin domain [Gammaproteobacteria bacterium]MBT5406201.1 phosphomannose isomerase type II C-terminal cupin domain [Gammaproteobacteria bacterium]MBT5643544.1 phosphomannose isomerase type II C-terminal cupin domain [Gammaproteobacteria bacterium]MBT5863673.1 phosphomannose isomerase type II C-terminal cupin domain [Gammaproteobacteria bacterium]MBT6733757.1 phosphomannose isomerase type II C-terminal cupin domain [Gammaproteobacteria bacterium]|tara:strand:+ start:1940 stop:2287 length:348 start_codon:yes stop_codon:yes gene_type:complete